MRVTNNMMISNMTRNLQTNIRRLAKTELQYNTGKRIHKPSDDPVGITRSLKLTADISELHQFKKNVQDALSWVENTEDTVIGYTEVLKRLRDLTEQAANGVLTDEETKKIKSEVAELKQQIISQGNTAYSGNYIFSGKNTDTKLFDENGNYTMGLDAARPGVTDLHTIKFQIGVGETININTLGTSLFEIDPTAPGGGNKAGIITLVEDIEDLLEDGNSTKELTDKLGEIDKYIDKALTIRGDIGARVNRLELIVNRIEDDVINLRALKSKIEDIDQAETAIQLMNEENVYRASLQVGARIIQPSLLDFLR
ncbi:flagellar hook-associated protein FlgL [Alkaliphilus sp. MSJ-5]|uniref:Flagellar hook-associated protein FlgL n=1 Tax=Alkaliphilus flagellatus TaxID=2841507 RepID=A0ABS6G2E9_9FIRM|nr:flagellar hook-associated protein FlgL [Alkaliphilus flagellatus]MBU5676657.1 flagellar hook-associated protein FlgL [Alkaliphilus flagellatus]